MAKAMITPVGVARFAHLEIPDEYEGNVQYKTDLILPDNKRTRALIEQLEEIRDEYFETLPKRTQNKLEMADVYSEELDENDEATGNLVLRFKMNAQYEDAKGRVHELSPDRVDARKQPLSEDTRIFGGSKIKVAFKPMAYDGFGKCGISCRLIAVQVIELAQSNAGNLFDEEDGFTEDLDESNDSDDSREDDESPDDMF